MVGPASPFRRSDESQSPAFQPGRPDVLVALVLAAPGLEERVAGHPAAGRPGAHLDVVLGHLHSADPETFPWTSRRDYRIVNAVSDIMHGERTVPRLWQIRRPENLERLRRQLGGFEVTVAFGNEALAAVRSIGIEPTFHTAHPGLRGISQLPVSDEAPAGRTADRLRLVANVLLESRDRCSSAAERLRALRASEKARRAGLGAASAIE